MDTLQHHIFTNDTDRKDWIRYYRNTWIKNSIAQTVDVQHDEILKAKNPNEMVMRYDEETGQPTGQIIPVKQRLELRKISLENTLRILEAVKLLERTPVEEFENTFWSEKALAIAPDMVEKPAEVAPVPTPSDPATPEAGEEAKV